MTRDEILQFGLTAGEAVLWSCAAVEVAAWCWACLRVPIGWSVVLAVLLPLTLLCWWGRIARPSLAGHVGNVWTAVVLALVVSGIWLFSLIAAWWFYDVSFDGQAYHQLAVIGLTDGWNPLQTSLPDQGYGIFVNTYPKGTWLAQGLIAGATGRIETAKAFNILILIASALIATSAMTYRPEGRRWWAAIAVLAVANPLAVSQMLSFCVDGQLASLLLVIVVELFVCWPSGRHRGHLLTAALAVFLTVGTKHTGVVYALSLLLAAGYGYAVVERLRLAKWMAVAGSLALVVNLNPYLTNTLKYGNPFYPIVGKDAPGRPTAAVLVTPTNFQDRPWLVSAALSVLSESSWCVNHQPGRLKMPFSVHRTEIEAFGRGESVRSGGFGPLFGMVTLVTIGSAAGLRRRAIRPSHVLLLLGLIVPTLAVPAWWARYVPQFWYVPLLIAWLLAARKGTRATLPVAILVVAAANVGLVAYGAMAFQYRMTKAIRTELASMRTGGPVAVNLDLFASTGRRLTEARVAWRPLAAGESCSNRGFLIGSFDAYICPDGRNERALPAGEGVRLPPRGPSS